MNNWLKTILFITTAIYISGCIGSRTIITNTKPKKRSAQFLLRQLEKNKIQYNWFGAKAKIKYEGKDNTLTFSSVIRMKKDSLIWIKLKKMNVEGVRVKITPETIEILNRQESTYTNKPFSYLKKEFGLNLTFLDLQELIIGNPILYPDQKLIPGIENNLNVLKTPSTQKSVLKIFMEPDSFHVKEIRGSIDQNSMCIEYDEYEKVNNQLIPALKDIHINSKKGGIIKVKTSFSKIIINEAQKVGFVIPENYRRN
ncbi:MAG: DUF4292 domain-containing protein [Saprospiraceae bacterium]|nr:DUF4292 domain-containing protein [Saprospiraceae bacterium]